MSWRYRRGVLDCDTRVRIMGILNATPDSFYDGGRYVDPAAAVERGLELVAAGADVIDVGGESSRPPMYGAVHAVDAATECERVLPVLTGLRRQTDVALSIDTTKAAVAARALDAGADMINDISAMTADAAMAGLVASRGAGVVLMHMRGTPATMQQDTHYDDLLGEVHQYLAGRVQVAIDAGVERDCIAVDPGVGFGKSVDGNLRLIRHLDRFAALGCPVLLGASRKSFIWKTLGGGPEDGLEGSLAMATAGVLHGARILRVHDVAATVRAVRLTEALLHADADAE